MELIWEKIDALFPVRLDGFTENQSAHDWAAKCCAGPAETRLKMI